MEGAFKAILFLIFYFNLMYFMDMPHRAAPVCGDVFDGVLAAVQIVFMYWFVYCYCLGTGLFERLKSKGAEVLLGLSVLFAFGYIVYNFFPHWIPPESLSNIFADTKKQLIVFMVLGFMVEVKNRSSRMKTGERFNSKNLLKEKESDAISENKV